MRLNLGSHLSWYVPGQVSRMEILLANPVHLLELLSRLKLPPAEVAVAAVNGRWVSLETAVVTDVDRVDLHPPVGGG